MRPRRSFSLEVLGTYLSEMAYRARAAEFGRGYRWCEGRRGFCCRGRGGGIMAGYGESRVQDR